MTFANSEQLYDHLVNVHIDSSKTSSGDYNCHWLHCSVSVSKRYRIISHLLCHVSFRPFKCPHCDKRFKRSHDARKHVKLIHEMNSSQLYYKRGKSKSSDSSPDMKSYDESQSMVVDSKMEEKSKTINHTGSPAEALNLSFAKLVAYCQMVRTTEFTDMSAL